MCYNEIHRNFKEYEVKNPLQLTPAQEAAIAKWEESRRMATFVGTTKESLTAHFAAVNALMATDPEKARANEKAWLALCGVSDPDT
jgi:hypothetical protein